MSECVLPIRVVECDGVHHVPVAVQGEKFPSRCGVPDFAGSVIAACDEAKTGISINHKREKSCVLIRPHFLPAR